MSWESVKEGKLCRWNMFWSVVQFFMSLWKLYFCNAHPPFLIVTVAAKLRYAFVSQIAAPDLNQPRFVHFSPIQRLPHCNKTWLFLLSPRCHLNPAPLLLTCVSLPPWAHSHLVILAICRSKSSTPFPATSATSQLQVQFRLISMLPIQLMLHTVTVDKSVTPAVWLFYQVFFSFKDTVCRQWWDGSCWQNISQVVTRRE